MSTAELSIVIPSYNGMPHLPAAVESAMNQQGCKVSVTVIDNASTDDTAAYLRSVEGSGVRTIRQPTLVNVYDNWTRAIDASDAPFVKLLCADDVLMPSTCAIAVAQLRSHPEAVLAASKRRIIDDRGRKIISARGLEGLSEESSRTEVAQAVASAGTNVIGEPSAVVFRRDALIAELPWSDRWPYVVDAEMYLRVLQHGTLVCVPEVGAEFRLTTTGWSNQLMASQSAQVADWLSEIAKDPSLEITDKMLQTGRKRAKSNAAKRRLLYALLRMRERVS
ncbi:MAG: glycosyltransferase family A protein [Candidatus Nanopelagicales bacterium]